MSVTPLKVGIVGLGTVGQGVVRVLAKNAAAIAARAGRPIVVTDVSVRTAAAKRDCVLDGIRIHATPEAVVAADVDVVCELIGGTELANDLTLAALAGGKSVVTANKALIAEKSKGHKPVVAEEPEDTNVVDLMAALRASLGGKSPQADHGRLVAVCAGDGLSLPARFGDAGIQGAFPAGGLDGFARFVESGGAGRCGRLASRHRTPPGFPRSHQLATPD